MSLKYFKMHFHPNQNVEVSGEREDQVQHSPVVVPLAVRFAVTHEARAALVQKLRAVRTLEAGGVPLQVRGHAHDVLVVDLRPAANARGCASLLCKVRKQMTVINGVGHVIGTLLKKKKGIHC